MITVNNIQIKPTIFPDKTSQIWKLHEYLLSFSEFIIRWDFENEAEFLHLAQLKDLLDQHGIYHALELPYLPYARQDKEVTNESTFALRTFAKLLNTLEFQAVYITDPHSKIATELIDNCVVTYPTEKIKSIIEQFDINLSVYPDKGALVKYAEIYPRPYIYGEKIRDQSTGNITSYKLVGNCKDKNVLIIDDICDGGMTFKLLAQELLKFHAKEVNLFVTHGIFSKGLETLKESGIKRIFTKDGEK